MIYTKDNGDISNRKVIVVSKPRENYLVYDVTKLTGDQINYFQETLEIIEYNKVHNIQEFEQVTGIKEASLWRSFKPGGIDWKE